MIIVPINKIERYEFINRVRSITKKFWGSLTKEEQLKFSEKCCLNKDRIDDFTKGLVIRLFANGVDNLNTMIATRISYVLMSNRSYPKDI